MTTTPTPPSTDTVPWKPAEPDTGHAGSRQAEQRERAESRQSTGKVPQQAGPPAQAGPAAEPGRGERRGRDQQPVPPEQAGQAQRAVHTEEFVKPEGAAPTDHLDVDDSAPSPDATPRAQSAATANARTGHTAARTARSHTAPSRSGPPRGGPPGRQDSRRPENRRPGSATRRPSASALRAAAARERERQPPFWFASRLLLVLSGQRPVHTLLRHTRNSAYDQLSRLAAQAPLRPLGTDRRTPAVLEAHGSQPVEGVIEAYARVLTGGRQRAMAFRLEHCADRQWRCAAVELDGLSPVRQA